MHLAEAFDQRGLPWTEWNLSSGVFDLAALPPEGVFYNRMSASSHTRGHRYAAELTAGVLAWLTRHGRRVVDAAREHFTEGPVILKPNRGGKGLGVRLFPHPEALEAELRALPEDEYPADGLWLLQDYVRAERPVITRAEFVGGRFLYAVEVDTSAGFELCPADVCAIDSSFCPTEAPAPRFRVLENGIDSDLRARLEAFLAANGIEVAGIEFIRATDGQVLTYDVNTNTNYNPEAEAKAGLTGTDRSGPGAIAAFLKTELAASVAQAA